MEMGVVKTNTKNKANTTARLSHYFTTLRYQLQHCVTSYNTALLVTTLRYQLQHCVTSYNTALLVTTLRYQLQHCVTSYNTALLVTTLRYQLQHCVTSYNTALLVTTLRYQLQHCVTSYNTALLVTTLRYQSQHCDRVHYQTGLKPKFLFYIFFHYHFIFYGGLSSLQIKQRSCSPRAEVAAPGQKLQPQGYSSQQCPQLTTNVSFLTINERRKLTPKFQNAQNTN